MDSLFRSKKMWPFSSAPKTSKRLPTVSIGDVVAYWGDDAGWEFTDPVLLVDCTLFDNDEFNESLVTKLPMVRHWIAELNGEINNAVNEYASASKLHTNCHEMQGIDVSELSASNLVDICYTATDDQWADFAINVVLINGRIDAVYGGD